MAAAGHHLVGRDTEFTRISSALETGGSVLLRGGAGVGKTALLTAWAADIPALALTGGGELPFSAFIHLSDAEWHEPNPTALAAALYRHAVGTQPKLLVVDDAHGLDPASAGLVLQLARAGIPVLAAARTGMPLPRAVQVLLRRRSETVEVGELPTPAVRLLMERQLGGPVSLAFATTVAARTGGNPLSVREVVSRLKAAGTADQRQGLWVLTGPMPVLDVADLLAERIDALPGRVRLALELLAVGGALPLRELLAAVGEDAVTRGEAEGVVRVTDGVARPGHPLQRDAVLSALPAGRRTRLHETLLRISRPDPAQPITAAQRALWRLEAGLGTTADELLAAAELMFSTSIRLSERLAAAAEARAERPDQALRLAGIWVNLGRAADAYRVLERVQGQAEVSALQIPVIALRALTAWLIEQRPDHALALVDDGVARFGPDPMLEAQRACALWRLGRADEARDVADRVARDGAAPGEARANAGATRHSLAAQLLDESDYAAAKALVTDILAEHGALLSAGRATFAITVAGRRVLFEEDLGWAETHLRGSFVAALERGEEQEAMQYGWLLGWSLAMRGRPLDAIGAMPGYLELGGPWAAINATWATTCYVRALVAAGRVEAARTEFDRLQQHMPAPMFAGELALAEVDLLAAEGRRPAAIALARRSIGRAMDVGSGFRAVTLAWALFLLGAPDGVRQLGALVAGSSVPLHEVQLRVASACAARDVGTAVLAASDLHRLGHRWHALEAVSVAAGIGGGSEAEVAALRALHARLTEDAPPIVTRAVPIAAGGVVGLTAREREVARLAARGLTDRQIAERLVVSVRTVETHMAHVFTKTGVHHRGDLAGAL